MKSQPEISEVAAVLRRTADELDQGRQVDLIFARRDTGRDSVIILATPDAASKLLLTAQTSMIMVIDEEQKQAAMILRMKKPN